MNFGEIGAADRLAMCLDLSEGQQTGTGTFGRADPIKIQRSEIDAYAYPWLTSGRYFVFLIRGSTVGLFLGGPGPPVPVISGRFWGVRRVRAVIKQICF